MSNDVGKDILDGRSTGVTTLFSPSGQQIQIQDGQVLPYRPVEHYRQVHDSRDRNVARNRGTLGAAGYGGPKAGMSWDTPSMADGSTVAGEIWDVLYVDPNGQDWTGMDMVIELFKALKGFK